MGDPLESVAILAQAIWRAGGGAIAPSLQLLLTAHEAHWCVRLHCRFLAVLQRSPLCHTCGHLPIQCQF
eukprot:2255602-Pyramimonas_sp.AAC.1